MSNAQSALRNYIDRVLRLKEEQDAISSDIREVYAEAKAEGFDKTVMGQVVSYLRKKEKDPAKFAENNEVFNLYIASYETGTINAIAHTHEAEPYKPDIRVPEAETLPDAGREEPATATNSDFPEMPAFLKRGNVSDAV